MRLCGLAKARVQARELDGACRAATLGRRLGSERVRNQLIEFRRTIQPHAAATPVKDFDAKCADLLHATATAFTSRYRSGGRASISEKTLTAFKQRVHCHRRTPKRM